MKKNKKVKPSSTKSEALYEELKHRFGLKTMYEFLGTDSNENPMVVLRFDEDNNIVVEKISEDNFVVHLSDDAVIVNREQKEFLDILFGAVNSNNLHE